ncbi:MAG: FMN-binding protein [Pseudomonadota bacterium]
MTELHRKGRVSCAAARRRVLSPFLLFLVVLFQAGPTRAEVYQTPENFLAECFSGGAPKPDFVWLTGALAEQVRNQLGHSPQVLRLRYWADAQRSAWILDEIGKTEPITAGIMIEDQKIARLRVLEFRESRGAEVRHSYFTRQFEGLSLQESGLSEKVDGIAGATLSVRAVGNMAKLALLLDRHIRQKQEPAP